MNKFWNKKKEFEEKRGMNFSDVLWTMRINYYNNNILSRRLPHLIVVQHKNPNEPIVIAQYTAQHCKCVIELWMNKINRGGCNWNHLVVNAFRSVIFSVDTCKHFIIICACVRIHKGKSGSFCSCWLIWI